jgi:genome maintenance exonuclease 1
VEIITEIQEASLMIEKQFDLQLSDLQKLPRRNVNGKRLYETPDGSYYPSVTTITGQMNAKAISEWRQRVGEKVATQITKQASARGTSIHKLCEHYILGTMDDVQIMPSNKEMFNAMADHLAETVGKVYAVEGFLYSDFLRSAGQVDMVAEYNGTLSIVDFKTAKKKKREDWIQNYFVQEAAYSFMFEERTGLQVPQLVTVIGVDGESEPQVFIKNTKERNQYLLQFLSLREQFEEATAA